MNWAVSLLLSEDCDNVKRRKGFVSSQRVFVNKKSLQATSTHTDPNPLVHSPTINCCRLCCQPGQRSAQPQRLLLTYSQIGNDRSLIFYWANINYTWKDWLANSTLARKTHELIAQDKVCASKKGHIGGGRDRSKQITCFPVTPDHGNKIKTTQALPAPLPPFHLVFHTQDSIRSAATYVYCNARHRVKTDRYRGWRCPAWPFDSAVADYL